MSRVYGVIGEAFLRTKIYSGVPCLRAAYSRPQFAELSTVRRPLPGQSEFERRGLELAVSVSAFLPDREELSALRGGTRRVCRFLAFPYTIMRRTVASSARKTQRIRSTSFGGLV